MPDVAKDVVAGVLIAAIVAALAWLWNKSSRIITYRIRFVSMAPTQSTDWFIHGVAVDIKNQSYSPIENAVLIFSSIGQYVGKRIISPSVHSDVVTVESNDHHSVTVSFPVLPTGESLILLMMGAGEYKLKAFDVQSAHTAYKLKQHEEWLRQRRITEAFLVACLGGVLGILLERFL